MRSNLMVSSAIALISISSVSMISGSRIAPSGWHTCKPSAAPLLFATSAIDGSTCAARRAGPRHAPAPLLPTPLPLLRMSRNPPARGRAAGADRHANTNSRELERRQLHELAREIAVGKLESAHAEMAKLSAERRREWLRRQWAARLGDIQP